MSKIAEIVVFSNCKDTSTSEVIEWTYHYGGHVSRINRIKDVVSFLDDYPRIQLVEQTDETDEFRVWFRRTPEYETPKHLTNSIETDNDIQKFYSSEQRAFLVAFYNAFEGAKWLNKWSNVSPAKLDQLRVAKLVGLLTPTTYIITSKDALSKAVTDGTKLINKPIQQVSIIKYKESCYLQYTKSIGKDEFKLLSESFFPALFQKCIEKNLELRVFYLDGRFYCMAICSTFDRQTADDFRRYNDKYPNRNVPYKLPVEIEEKLRLFMNRMCLNSGSIDVILDNHGDYYFLEVNPVGQFGMVSYPCNYYLERDMARYLTIGND